MSVFTSTGYEETLTQLAAILTKHFADPRIVGTGNTYTLAHSSFPPSQPPQCSETMLKCVDRSVLTLTVLSSCCLPLQISKTLWCSPWLATSVTHNPSGQWRGSQTNSECLWFCCILSALCSAWCDPVPALFAITHDERIIVKDRSDPSAAFLCHHFCWMTKCLGTILSAVSAVCVHSK